MEPSLAGTQPCDPVEKAARADEEWPRVERLAVPPSAERRSASGGSPALVSWLLRNSSRIWWRDTGIRSSRPLRAIRTYPRRARRPMRLRSRGSPRRCRRGSSKDLRRADPRTGFRSSDSDPYTSRTRRTSRRLRSGTVGCVRSRSTPQTYRAVEGRSVSWRSWRGRSSTGRWARRIAPAEKVLRTIRRGRTQEAGR
jgi:hypothetical protein